MKPCPFEILDLPNNATESELKRQWRKLASIHHPDRGGDAEVFKTLKKAYLDACKKLKVCKYCGGSKLVVKRYGFFSLQVPCGKCK